MRAENLNACESDRLFRTVTALGAELRRQGALNGSAGIDLIDLAYVAMATSVITGRQDAGSASIITTSPATAAGSDRT
jgi:hypothetical protein